MDHMNFTMAGMAPHHRPQQQQQRHNHVISPPPPIFGAYGPVVPDASLSQLPPDLAAQMLSDAHLAYDDVHDPKRRRIARACDMCRKKKIKCDGRLPACTQCINYKTDCVFTHVEKKRTPPKGAKYIEGLENRLDRMENLLRLSGVLGEDEESTDLAELEKRLEEKNRRQSARLSSGTAPSPATSLSQPPAAAPNDADGSPRSMTAGPSPGTARDSINSRDDLPVNGPHSPNLDSGGDEQGQQRQQQQQRQNPDDVSALSDMMCSLVTTQTGETRYLGSSSGFSIFSPKGIQWVNAKTGDDSFQKTISEVSDDDHKWTNWKPHVFNDVFRRTVFRPLPPKDEALSLLKDYFENFNCMLPLFHQPTFMHLVHRQYSSDMYQGSGWWASLNCALAIAHRLRVMTNLVPQEEDDKAWGYLKNAMGVFTELTMRNADLLSVQGLLGMALFMQGTPNPQPSTLLVAAAIRLAHTIGLHKRGTGFNLNPIEIEQRKRVFWIAYMLDKDLCLRAGRPPAQDDDDMNVDLPDADPDDNIGNIPLADGKGKMNLFRTMCEFAIIESTVYKKLYSTSAAKRPVGELLSTIGELDRQLEEWKDAIPIDFRPEHEIKASHTPLILHVVMLHFTYYNCLTTIHRMSVDHGFWTSRLADYAVQGLNTRALNPRVYSSAALCTAAARASISLIKYIPQGDFSCVWMILYFPVSALMTLFANILNNPLDPRAKSDTKLINLVVTFLSMLGKEAEQGGVHRMLGVCAEFERIAKSVIDKALKDQSLRRKRKNNGEVAAASAEKKQQQHQQQQQTSSSSNDDDNSNDKLTTEDASVKRPGSRPDKLSVPIPGTMNSGNGSGSNLGEGSRRPVSSSPTAATAESYSPALVSPDSSMPMTSATSDLSFSDDFFFGGTAAAGAGAGFPGNVANGNSIPGVMGGLGPYGGGGGANGQDGRRQQQPLLPSDLFSLPMNLDWNWAELSGGAYPTVENGNFGQDP